MQVLKSAYTVLVRKPEGKRPLRMPRHKWEGNIKISLKQRGQVNKTKFSRKILGSHSNEYEADCLLGCCAM
jgi:hypothetical protein